MGETYSRFFIPSAYHIYDSIVLKTLLIFNKLSHFSLNCENRDKVKLITLLFSKLMESLHNQKRERTKINLRST